MIKSMIELEREYKRFVTAERSRMLDLGLWLPHLGKVLRPVRPGELVVIMADTGHGKTAILQNIAYSNRELDCCLFELELPGTACFERFMAISNNEPQWVVEKNYQEGYIMPTGPANHIYVCDLARVQPSDIETILKDSAVQFDVLLVDYIGLMAGGGNGSRYERVSQNAEELKRVARNTNTVLVVSSQVHRKPETEITLHDAKDSGSIENSAQLVLGAWRLEEYDNKKMMIKVLKATSGGSTEQVLCDFDGGTLRITQSLIGIDGIY